MVDPETFRLGILPGLQEIPLSAMMQATGLSRGYCWMIRRGDYMPHPRHWERLRGLGHIKRLWPYNTVELLGVVAQQPRL